MADIMRRLLMLITSVTTCLGQYLKSNNMAQKKIIIADTRMRKFLILITPI